MYETKKELLSELSFGNVDSESEQDLDKKFIKTKEEQKDLQSFDENCRANRFENN